MKKIKCPENFDLYYSIYHPLLLLTSRQCLFHQVDGCSKIRVDNKCIESCEKHSNLDKLNGDMFFLDKKAGNYHCIYNDKNYLNCDIIEDKKDFFTSYFIDLRDVKTDTKLSVSKTNIIHEFNKLLNNESVNMQSLISNTDCSQYIKGI